MPINVADHPMNYIDRPEQIWVVVPKGDGPIVAHSTEEAARRQYAGTKGRNHAPEEVTLHKPSLQPIYGGPTLLEALWAEMDRLMEALMTGTENAEDFCSRNAEDCNVDADDFCRHPDSGDKYRAQELAWVLAVVSNAYNPSVDRIRAEAMARWNAQQDEDEKNTRPEGADQ